MSTAKEICEGVSTLLLDSTLSDIHLSDIVSHITEWQELAPYLDLNEVEEKDIVDTYPNSPKLQRREALRKWKESNGNKATYHKLICILCSHGRAQTAQSLKKLLVQQTNSTSIEQDLDNFHEYIKDCYLNLEHPSSLQWPFSSNQSYAELDFYDAPFGKDCYLKEIALRSIFSDIGQGTTRKVVLIEGIAGSGKTTLCWYICTEWAAGRLFKDVKVLIHLSFSDMSIHSVTKLADLIPHPSEYMREAIARAVADARGKGVCFLLDACDEAPLSFRRSFLFQFIAGTERKAMIPYVNILLTSRPGLPHELVSCISRRVVIKGFKSLEEFIESTLQTNIEKRRQLLEALKMKPELESLCHIPLHAIILVHLFDYFKDNLPTTRTGLFHPLVCNFLIRHMGTRTNHPLGKVFDLSIDLPQDVYTSFKSISELAYQSLIGMHLEVPESMLKKAGMIPLWEEKFGFFRAHKRITAYGPTEAYSFSHLSLQEFLAAFYITQLNAEHDQAVAFRQVYKQNPLSPVLSFFAGLTGLRSEEICKLLYHVMEKPFDLNTTVKELEKTGDIANDKRRQLLSLMNCIYETQQPTLIDRVSFTPVDSYKKYKEELVASSDYAAASCILRPHHIEIPLSFMMLYATDCLSVGYFIRYVWSSRQKFNLLLLNLSKCIFRSLELKALYQELCKPVKVLHNCGLILNISYIPLTNEALETVKAILSSTLYGLIIAGECIENIHLALKYIIEGISYNLFCEHLSILQLNTPLPVAHHLTLLVYHCQLTALGLSGSKDLFVNPKVMVLFCEALKHNQTLDRLILDGCGIDDSLLIILAHALTSGCTIKVLDLGWNPHTSQGLRKFLYTLIVKVRWTLLLVLATSTDISAEHNSLIKGFNHLRQYVYPSYGKLTVGCKNKLSPRDDVTDNIKFFGSRPQYIIRSPHE